MLFCTWWFGVSAYGMGRKVLSDMYGASPVLFETGFWDFIIYIWAIWAIIAIWHDPRISGKERHLVPLWDRL